MECKVCNYVCGNKQGLSRHLRQQHELSLSGYQINYIYKEHPTCKCGCGEKTNWYCGIGDFREYLKDHKSKSFKLSEEHKQKLVTASKNRSKEQNRLAGLKSVETKRINGTLKQSDATKRKKSESIKKAYRNGTRKPWQQTNPNAKAITEKISEKRNATIKSLKENGTYSSGIGPWSNDELTFKKFLDGLSIRYECDFKIACNKHKYDFYLIDYNLIVEIFGYYWHCNPDNERYNEHFVLKQKNMKATEVWRKDQMFKEDAIKEGYKYKVIWTSQLRELDISSLKQEVLP
jgi:hypothetical protein